MNPLDVKVLAVLRTIGQASESHVCGMLPGFLAQSVGNSLQRLRSSKAIERLESGHFSFIEPEKPEATAPPAPAIATEETMTTEKKCPVCDGAEFTAAGTCKECKRRSNAKYAEKKGAKRAPAAPPKRAKKKTPAPAIADTGSLAVMKLFSISITDRDRKQHDIVIDQLEAQRLLDGLTGCI
jgi:hypothetical protein